MIDPKQAGPVPGENYTSDTRNYPWHRPPEIETYDGTVEYIMDRMTDETTAEIVYSLMKMGRPLTNIVAGLMMQGIGRGKFQIDMAVLAAGPVFRYLQALAEAEGISHETGLDRKRVPITSVTLKRLMGVVDDEGVDALESDTEARTAPSEGLMGKPSLEDTVEAPAEEQAAMLGMTAEEEEV